MIKRYAKLDENNIVENVILCEESQISTLNGIFILIEEKHISECGPAVGDTYFPEKDKFKERQWWDSWTWDEDLWKYVPPVPKPTSGKWLWDSDNEEWFEVISVPAD